jgi:dolichyl-phosphate-mannose-protein mannosyltransferase/glycosyl transferase family 22 (putative mannosyltransferase)
MHTTGEPLVDRDRSWHRTFAWIALALSLIVYPLLLLKYTRANSATFDEGMHIAAGHRYWECGDYAINPEHPPLLKLIAAMPLRHWTFAVYSSACGTAVTNNMQLIGTGYRLMNGPAAAEILFKARTAAMVFPILLLVTMFFAARAWFGPLAAGCAVILTVFEPNLTAHGPLVTTDMAVATTTFAAVFCADRYLSRPATWRLLLLGFTLGLALASKHTAVFVPLILLIQFLAYYWLSRWASPRPSLPRLLLGWLAACLIALFVLWGTYQFRFSALPGRAQAFEIPTTLQNGGESQTLLGRTILGIAHFHLLPESYVAGLLYVIQNSTRPSYIFGKRHGTGVWYYFPVTILVKTPLTILLLVVLAVASPAQWRKPKREIVVVAIPIAVFLFSAMSSKINLGVRHILPIYPFLIVLAACAICYYAARSRIAAASCAALLVFQAGSYARSYPNEIAYANEAWGGPQHLYRYLGDSNVDWGQALHRVKDHIAARGISDCWIAWFGARKPTVDGLPCRLLAGPGYVEAVDPELQPILPERFSGTVFVSNTLIDYDLYPYLYFLQHPPDDVVAGSILVYHGDFDLPEIAAERRASRGWWYLNHQQAASAVQEFAAAEAHAVAPGEVHSLYAWALVAAGRPSEARAKYEQAAADFAGKPADEQWRKAALDHAAALQQAESNTGHPK